MQSRPLPTESSNNGNIFIMLVLVILVLCGTLFYISLDSIKGMLWVSQSSSTGLQIGQQVTLSWVISSNGDLQNYTHTFQTSGYGIIGIKSKTINLNDYEGNIELIMTIEDTLQNMPIGEVTYASIISENIVTSSWELLSWDSLTGSTSIPTVQYFPQARLIIDPLGDDAISATINPTAQTVTINDSSNPTPLVVSYYRCKKGDALKDCAALTKNFSASSSEQFSSIQGITYFKVGETNQWFFSSDTNRGYTVETKDQALITRLSKNITLINEQFIKDQSSSLITVCTKNTADETLSSIDSSKLQITTDKLQVLLKGKNLNGTGVECTLELKAGSPLDATLIDLKVSQSAASTATTTNNTSTLTVNPDVTQFKVNTGSPLVFTSSRGFSIVYPSQKIAFQSKNIDETFDIKGVKCYGLTSIVDYNKRSTLDTSSGSIQIYECTIKDGITDFNGMLLRQSGDGKKFLINVIDPSWTNFGNMIEIR